jgi:hypothetical protein
MKWRIHGNKENEAAIAAIKTFIRQQASLHIKRNQNLLPLVLCG